MTTSARKQREFAQREQLFLETARSMLLDIGYINLTIDRIADKTDYSKGTIYQHFSCKEEIVVALLINSSEKVQEFLQRAASFNGKSRERIIAMVQAYELFVRLFPHHFKAENLTQNESIREKASVELQKKLQAAEQRNIGIVTGVIRDAIAQGDLQSIYHHTPEELTFGLWAGCYGAYVLMDADIPLEAFGIKDPISVCRHNVHALLDGFGWRPLSGEWNYEQTYERVWKEIFPQERRMVEG